MYKGIVFTVGIFLFSTLTFAQQLVREECIGSTTNDAIVTTHENKDGTTSLLYEIFDSDPAVLNNLTYRIIKFDQNKNTLFNKQIDSLLPYLQLYANNISFDDEGGFFAIYYDATEDSTGTIQQSRMRGAKFDNDGNWQWGADSIPYTDNVNYIIRKKKDGGYLIYNNESELTESVVVSISNTGKSIWKKSMSKSGIFPDNNYNFYKITFLPLSNKNTFFRFIVYESNSWGFYIDSSVLVYGLLDTLGNLIKSDTLPDTQYDMINEPVCDFSSSNSIILYYSNRSMGYTLRAFLDPYDLSYIRTDSVNISNLQMFSYNGVYDDSSHLFFIPSAYTDSTLHCFDIHFNLLWEYNTGVILNNPINTIIVNNNTIFLNNELIENGERKWISQAEFDDTIYYDGDYWVKFNNELHGANTQFSYTGKDIYFIASYYKSSCTACKTLYLIKVLDMQNGSVKDSMLIVPKPDYFFYQSYYDHGKFMLATNENNICYLGQYDVYIGYYSHNFNSITGTAFIDSNNNNLQDNGEPFFGDGYAITQQQDDIQSQHLQSAHPFNFYTDTGSYVTKLQLYNDYYTVSPSQHITSHADYYHTDTIYFALHPVPGKNDIRTQLVNNRITRMGQNNRYTLSIHNFGTTTANGKLKLRMDSRLLNISTNPNYSYSHGDTLVWDISNFMPNSYQSATINFTADIPPSLNGGDTILSTAWFESDSIDLTPSDNTAEVSELIRTSYDPNEKSILSGSALTPSQISNGAYISYIIHFQNYGNDTAFKVVVLDTLSCNVDPASLQLIGSSHDYTLDILDNHILKFTFSNIRLSYDTLDVSSTGYVSYKVKPKTGLSLGSTIDNTAHIFFDYNQPIATNTVRTNIILLSAIKANQENISNLKLFPNPNTGKFSVQFENKTNGTIELEIVNIKGDVLYMEKKAYNTSSLFDIDMSHFPKGIYWLKLKDATSTYSSAVIVQ